MKSLMAGVDEAGRGPLAGPVVVAAVILDTDKPIDRLDDSKKLSEQQREALFPRIMKKALAYFSKSTSSGAAQEPETKSSSAKPCFPGS